MKKQHLLKIVQSVLSAESGRSMVEMLGVLAIIGVLSIGTIAGYKFALNKFRANEIINELNARALSVSAQMLSATTPYESDEVIEDGFGDTLAVGYSAESAVSSQNPDYFEITINGIPSEVCTQILRDYENPIMIFVNEVQYNNDTSLCTTESGTVDMGFIYRRDLGEREMCSERGYFGEEDFICHCAGNTYIDPNNPNACLCPAGHVWSGDENTCIESICDEGYFESKTNGCVPCSEDKNYSISPDERHQKLCQACGNRFVTLVETSQGTLRDGMCIFKNTCLSGYFMSNTGGCLPCNDVNVNIIARTADDTHKEERIKLCTDCPNRHIGFSFKDYYCVHNDMCQSGNEFLVLDVEGTGTVGCASCDTTKSYRIGTKPEEHALCNACVNDIGVKNRTVSGESCKKILCDSDEFMGADGACYSCTQGGKVAVNTGSGCMATTCGRAEVAGSDGKTYCQIANCPTDGTYANVDGSCYKCESKRDDYSVFRSTKAQCDQCGSKRLWVGTYIDETSIGRCHVPCKYGVEVPYSTNANNCYVCAGWWDGVSAVGTSDTAREYCNACPNSHWVETGKCIYNDACTRGEQVRKHDFSGSAYKICDSCDLVDKIEIGTHELEREVCSVCTTTKRFWAGSYCYRCDTSETPDIDPLNEAEVKSCTSCSIREVIEGKCVLKQ